MFRDMDSILLLFMLLLISRTQAYHIYGTVMTYYPKNTYSDGSVSVILRYKLNYISCGFDDSWVCSGNCGTATQSLPVTTVDQSSGDGCQREGITTYLLPNNSPLQLTLSGNSWTTSLNVIIYRRAVAAVELRKRSDSSKPNTSPQTTILPVIRLPSNCQRNINLLTFDPDGDIVKCRYGNDMLFECDPCTPPPVLSVSSSCTLSFSPNSSSSENSYAVQLMMEDFPHQTITLTHTSGSQEVKTTSSAISKIPIQFLLKVLPLIPSCTEGLYLPKFVPPTPDNGAQINITVNQMVEIPIIAQATASQIIELLFSGPYNVIKSTSGSGRYTLTWTSSDSESGQSHFICFAVQASYSSFLYQSELRCVMVQIIPPPPRFVYSLNLKISTAMSLENNKEVIEKLVKDELIKRGLTSEMSVRLLRKRLVQLAASSSSG
ncbi:uncharacterized protein LOC106523841 [Austrofundulus limnaeus]|uniref:Uncharacterized protein LOC106523841 n=1 Tax=Austrofundulus limnaeus TaxID=52670 RepID=A0A2I4BYP9_AUSLI|nr:PREDICTED: uncharacterized protein LOC106523841 [Austrofundulus limnaeus]